MLETPDEPAEWFESINFRIYNVIGTNIKTFSDGVMNKLESYLRI